MAQEHQEYIQTRVNPTLENLVTQVLLERPDNPVPFMIQWLAEQTKAAPQLESGEAERIRNEIRALKAEVGELEAKLGPASGGGGASTSAKANDKQQEESEEESDGEDLPPPPASYQQGKVHRASVSAEAYGAWNQVGDFKPPVHAKSEEQQTRLTAVLQKCFLFSTLDKANMKVIIDAMLEKPAAADERIIQEGDDGDCMFVIETGNIECKKKISGEDKVVKTCGPGDFFGELALLYNCPRAASVEARDAAVLWQLDRQTFNHIVRDASMKKREQYEKFLQDVKLFKTLGQYERGALADSLQKESFAAGSAVVTQGESGSRFYLVEKGELTASKDGKEVLKYKVGDYFGELALIKSENRAATVTADMDADLLWIDSNVFKSLLGSIEDVMKEKAVDYKP